MNSAVNPGGKEKTCAQCGEKFQCFAEQGPCWCDEVKVSSEELAGLRARHADCLCPNCLRAAAAAGASQR